MVAAQAAEPNLNPLTMFTSSSTSTEFKDILSWNISQEMITKTIPISTRIVISYAVKQGILFWIYWEVNGNWDNNMIRIPHLGESHCKTNTSIRRKKKIQKSTPVRIRVSDPSRKVNHLYCIFLILLVIPGQYTMWLVLFVILVTPWWGALVIKLATNQNHPKPAKTTHNQPKPPKTNQN